MQIDKITFNDISIFHSEEEYSIFSKLNFTRTIGGKEWLRRFFSEPHSDLKKIRGTQNIIKTMMAHIDEWPSEITNGTILVMDKFLDYRLDPGPANPNPITALSYRLVHSADYSMMKYSIRHFADFFRGMKKLEVLLSAADLPAQVGFLMERVKKTLNIEPLAILADAPEGAKFTLTDNLYFSHHTRWVYKSDILELMDIYGRLDAWYSMAFAVKKYNLQFPQFIESDKPFIEARGLYHVLLQEPVAYDLVLDQERHFLFLTGANMAGKSTLIRAAGSSVFLAHLGMGVPAASMRLTLFDGILSNINVADNIAKGESYFFNEVQRIKTTINKINDGKKWLVLIDELFKGTNVQDAMKCSLAVINGLIKINNSLFILSTHLYEIGEELKSYSSISFKYFETEVHDDQLSFSYQLKDGISNDRIGYVILRREKVVELLEQL
ncbi:MutS-related protein [Paracnuella aquatica]|uniref:MutS-related protein n=1 Tax=Paracnuella aquatica TaxID=2268757 RepID=UPI000DEF4A28|nr:DNA mismatch repair protein MutS [Paracnuella aquatica]RPD47527.1 DNA mismatch repair protein MutS [Paracnuella aquatica]